MTASQWFEERARLNHDFLLNKVLLAVTSALRRSDPGAAGPLLQLFMTRAEAFRRLLRNAPLALRPGTWSASQGVLGGLDEQRELLDLLFVHASSVPAACQGAEQTLDRSIAAAADALRELTPERLREAEAALQALSAALSRLPSSMAAVVETMA